MSKSRTGGYNIRVLERAVHLLRQLSDGRPRTLTQLSEELGMSSSTTFRLLATLSAHSLVERDRSDGKYRLGLAVLEMARSYFEGNDLRRIALPELERLRDRTGETVHLGILDEMQVVYLEKLHGHHAIGLMSSRVGGRSPAYCTGLGKVLLAHANPERVRRHFEAQGLKRYTPKTLRSVAELMRHLERVRAQGYALDDGEHEPEVRCVAAPVFDLNGEVVAAVSVSGPGPRMDPLESQLQLIEQTQRAARAISVRLGHRPSEAGVEQEGNRRDG
ncbi:MAG: IclR family transcriptional regulator [Chloroflexota bacterium]